MKTEKELKEIREKLVFILEDEFLNEELIEELLKKKLTK